MVLWGDFNRDNMENKNGGNDNINAKTLKALVELLVDPLTHIFNLCIDKAIWPDVLKSVDVISLYKSKEKRNGNNYRPISLILKIAKVLEITIHRRIIRLSTNATFRSKINMVLGKIEVQKMRKHFYQM